MSELLKNLLERRLAERVEESKANAAPPPKDEKKKKKKSKANHLEANTFELLPPPGDAISAIRYAPNSPTRLLVASWDRNLYLYDTHGGDAGTGTLIQKYNHRSPILDVCFGEDDNVAFTAGVDNQVKK